MNFFFLPVERVVVVVVVVVVAVVVVVVVVHVWPGRRNLMTYEQERWMINIIASVSLRML